MAGYLEEYGVADARRARIIRWIVIGVVSAVVVGLIASYVNYTLRTWWPAKGDVGEFLSLLQRKEYQAAYHAWGCRTPCRDYSFERFMADWGPQSDFADVSKASIKRTRVCSNEDVIVTLTSPKGEEVPLMYEHATGALGFSPWPICDPRIPKPLMPTAQP